ncbi:hypothetical protein [Deinococcus xinjiangensis]
MTHTIEQVALQSIEKCPCQIRDEWNEIQAKKPLERTQSILQSFTELQDRGLTTVREDQLINIIEELSKGIVSYHIEMGTLLRELA